MGIKLVLGSANFGQSYGVLHNVTGPTVSREMARRIVACAREIGIEEIDTALTYGPAQKWLAEFPEVASFRINSKIPWEGTGKIEKYISQIQQISDFFPQQGVHKLQWHNWHDEQVDTKAYFALHSKLSSTAPVSFGVTTYGVESVNNALRASSFSSIQLEYNILNQAPLNSYQEFKADTKPQIYIRSVFLQGALTQLGVSRIPKESQLHNFLMNANQLAHRWQISLHELALRSVFTAVDSASVVVGVTSESQLQELSLILDSGPLPEELVQQIQNLDASTSPDVDPRNWKYI